MKTSLVAPLIVAAALLVPPAFSCTHTQQPAAAGKMVQPESLDQGFIIVVDDKTRIANTNSPIHLASSHNGWNPADAGQRLSPRSDSRWQIILTKPSLDSKIAFKFTRGSWDLVEQDAAFKDIDNRLLPLVDSSKLAPGEKPVIELVIENWKDKGPKEGAAVALNRYREIKVGAGSIRRVEVTGGGITPAISRDVLVWLPPGYDAPENKDRRYPVLYLHDGQNVFEKLPGVPGEWKADETAGKLIADGKIEPLIIVGIPHAAQGRMQEYVPVPIFDGVPARGKEYIQFLLSEVKPRVERSFRIKAGPENTAIGGASLGGVISLEAATEHPEVFGKVLAESTPLVSKNRLMFRHFGAKKNWPGMVYFGMGGKEASGNASDAGLNDQYVQSASAFKELLEGRGVKGDRLKVVVEPAHLHNEEAWAARFPAALEFLFPASTRQE